MVRSFVVIVWLLSGCVVARSANAQPALLDVPADALVTSARKVVKDVYREEIGNAKSVESRVALAKKLISEAEASAGTPNERYVLLTEARDLCTGAGDAATAMEAVDRLGSLYKLSVLQTSLEALTKASERATFASQRQSVADCALARANLAVETDQYELADELAKVALAAARRARDGQLSNEATRSRAEIASAKTAHERVADARKAVAANPDNPAANVTLGRFYCFSKNDWADGLPYFEKGDDPTLRDLAHRDVSSPTDPMDQMNLADGWWELADAEKDKPSQARLMERAMMWYSMAAPAVTGISRAKAEKRLAAGSEIVDRNGGRGIDLLRLVDTRRDSVRGTWQRDGRAVVSPTSETAMLQIPFDAPESYNLTAEFTVLQGTDVEFGLVVGGRQCTLILDGWHGTSTGLEMIAGQGADRNHTTLKGRRLTPGKLSKVAISVIRNRISVRCNGHRIIEWSGDPNSLSVSSSWVAPNPARPYLGSHNSRVVFSQAQIRPLPARPRSNRGP